MRRKKRQCRQSEKAISASVECKNAAMLQKARNPFKRHIRHLTSNILRRYEDNKTSCIKLTLNFKLASPLPHNVDRDAHESQQMPFMNVSRVNGPNRRKRRCRVNTKYASEPFVIYTFVLYRGKCEVSDEYLQTNRGLMMRAQHLRTD